MSEETQATQDTSLQPYVDCDDCGSRSSADYTARPSQRLAIPAAAKLAAIKAKEKLLRMFLLAPITEGSS